MSFLLVYSPNTKNYLSVELVIPPYPSSFLFSDPPQWLVYLQGALAGSHLRHPFASFPTVACQKGSSSSRTRVAGGKPSFTLVASLSTLPGCVLFRLAFVVDLGF